MTGSGIDAVRQAVERGGEPDDVLRAAVEALAARDGVAWAGIAFVEGDRLVLGPQAGTPEEAARRRVPVRYRGATVAELWVDGDTAADDLDPVAELVAEHCLVGWDTGGVPWDA